MKSWFKVVWSTVKVFLAFACCTVFFYFGLVWLNQEYENYHRYDEPEGEAVKVFQMFGNDSDAEYTWLERLKIFYDIGE